MLTCERCQSDDIDLVGRLDDGRLRVRCEACGHTWERGTARAATKPLDTFAEAK